MAQARPGRLAGKTVKNTDSVDGYRFEMDEGWLLLRPSGTEPLLRIYTETTEKALVAPLLQAGRDLAGI